MDSIDFRDLFVEQDLDATLHGGNFRCPFCGTKAFKAYDDGRAHCHHCEWHGDAVALYSALKDVDRQQAYTALAELYGLGRIKPKTKTLAEARKGLVDDLEFLAWCRLYFAFYKNQRSGLEHYQRRSGFSRPQFSKVLNGRFDLVSRKAWNQVVLALRQSLNIGQLKRDLENSAEFWGRKIREEESLREAVSKFQ